MENNSFSQIYRYAKGWYDNYIKIYDSLTVEKCIVSSYTGIYPEDATDINFGQILREAVKEYLNNQKDGVNILMNKLSDTITTYSIIQDRPNNLNKLPLDPIKAHDIIMKESYLRILNHATKDTINSNLEEILDIHAIVDKMKERINYRFYNPPY